MTFALQAFGLQETKSIFAQKSKMFQMTTYTNRRGFLYE